MASAVAPYSCTWTGAGSDGNFSTAANWSDCNGGLAPVPTDGDLLIFPNAVNNLTPNNDLSGATFQSIAFSGSTLGGFTISGNSFTLTGGISDSSSGAFDFDEIDAPIVMSGNQTIAVSSVNTDLDLGGAVSGSGNLTKTGAGSLEFDANNSSWTGGLTANAGSIGVSDPNALGTGSAPGATINDGADIDLIGCNNVSFDGNLTLSGNSSITTGDFPNPKLGSDTGCNGSGAAFSDENYGYGVDTAATVTLNGTTTLSSDITFAGITGTTTISGPLAGAHTITMLPGYAGKLVVASSSNTSNLANGTYTSATFTKTLSDSSSDTVGISANNIITIDGTRGDTEVADGGILKGDGTVGALFVDTGGIVAPGHSPGCLNSSDLTLNGTYQAEIGGTTACTDYDQLNVTGAVDLSGSTLDASIVNGFVPKVGQSFTIINNDGSDPITGTFAGLAQGATFTSDGVTFSITYSGGSNNNDVVLTVTNVNGSQLPSKPNTGFQLIFSHPLLSLGTSTMVALTLVFIARRLKPVKA
jgi:autotransporter-associated beta strand protein